MHNILWTHGAVQSSFHFSALSFELANFACRRAKDLMQSNISVLHKTAEVLLEREQIDGDEFLRLILESQAENYLKADEPSVAVPYRNVTASA